MSEEVSIYGENAITGSINDAALAEKAEANGVTLTDNGETTNTETSGETVSPPEETAGATPDETKTPSDDDAPIEQKVADLKSSEDALKDDLKTKGVDFETAVSEYNEKVCFLMPPWMPLRRLGIPRQLSRASSRADRFWKTSTHLLSMRLLAGKKPTVA